jgi:hypothetical protein
MGLRKYFGHGVNFGAGVTGFYCNGDTFSQEVKVGTSGTPTKTDIKQSSQVYGGLLYLMLFWNDSGRAQKN